MKNCDKEYETMCRVTIQTPLQNSNRKIRPRTLAYYAGVVIREKDMPYLKAGLTAPGD